MWYVYLVACSDNTLYCGVTKDIDRRINEHNHLQKGAKYTRSRRPVRLVWSCRAKNRSEAQKEERRIKKLTRKEKLELIKG